MKGDGKCYRFEKVKQSVIYNEAVKACEDKGGKVLGQVLQDKVNIEWVFYNKEVIRKLFLTKKKHKIKGFVGLENYKFTSIIIKV